MAPFQLQILGDPVLLASGGPVTGRAAHKRRMALLAILAIARGRPVGRERLIGLLWPELPGDAARHNLSESLYVLRKELGDGAVVAVGGDVALSPAVVASDVEAFEAGVEGGDAEAAVRVYRGPLLDGFYVAEAPAFERWAEGERDRLARLFARTVERLAETAEAEGSAIRAVDWWRRLAAHDPFSSRTALRLVRALDAAGERPSALRFFESHAALLREELGVDPDPDLAAFVQRLKADEPRPGSPPEPLARFATGSFAAAAIANEVARFSAGAPVTDDSADGDSAAAGGAGERSAGGKDASVVGGWPSAPDPAGSSVPRQMPAGREASAENGDGAAAVPSSSTDETDDGRAGGSSSNAAAVDDRGVAGPTNAADDGRADRVTIGRSSSATKAVDDGAANRIAAGGSSSLTNAADDPHTDRIAVGRSSSIRNVVDDGRVDRLVAGASSPVLDSVDDGRADRFVPRGSSSDTDVVDDGRADRLVRRGSSSPTDAVDDGRADRLVRRGSSSHTDAVDDRRADLAVSTEERGADTVRPDGAILERRAGADRPNADAGLSGHGIQPGHWRQTTEGAAETRRWRDRRRWTTAAGGAGVLLGMVASLLAVGSRAPAPDPGPRYDPRRIAVLYFDDTSPHGELQYLANGLTDMLIHELSQVPALDVVSRGGVKPYRDHAVRFDSMVADLRAGSVVEGSVQRSRDSVFVTVELVDASTRRHLESRMVARPMGDVVELERALADEVAASLRRRLGREIRLGEVRRETRSTAAGDLVLRAEQLRDDAARLSASRVPLDAQSATRRLHAADSLLAAAEREDGGWARPTVLRGWVAVSLARTAQAGSAHDALLSAAVAHADHALEVDPGNAAALELRGTAWFALASDRPASAARALTDAERDLRAAVAADSSLATAWSTLSLLLRVRGRFAESDLTARRALEEDAYLDDAASIRQRLAFSAMSAGDYPAARAECDRAARQFPADWRFVECRLTLLRQDPAERPDPALAWRLVAELERMDPPEQARSEGRAYSAIYRRMVAAAVSARAGGADTARAVLARARSAAAASADLRLSLDYDEAYLRMALGERDAARAVLAHLLAARPWMRPYVARDPLLRDLAPPAPAAPAPPTR